MQDEKITKRLKTINGHLGGVIKMVDEGKYCIDVIHQIQAVQSSLNKVTKIILENHMNSCMITAVRGDDIAEREKVLSEIADVFETANKI